MQLTMRQSLQMQMEREKQNYDFENLQSQLDKALGQSTRMQKERETIQLEVDRLQDKYEKAQVSVVRSYQGSDAIWPLPTTRLVTPGHNATAAEGAGQLPGGNGEDAREAGIPAESDRQAATR